MIADKFFSLLERTRFQPGVWLLMRPQDQGLRFSRFDGEGWIDITDAVLPSPSRFSRHILLLPEQQCVFRHRSFPLDLLGSADLDEAVVLDMDRWVPFQEPCDHLYFARRDKDNWSVAVWVWPKSLTSESLAMLPEKLACTHIMPELAWSSICLQHHAPALLIQTETSRQIYAFVSSDGVPQAISEVSGEHEARRFCLGFMERLGNDGVFVSGDGVPYWLADRAQRLPACLPRSELLDRARCPGITDWRDPLAWKKPIIALMAALMLWMAGDAVVVNLAAQSVDAALADATAAAGQVLQDRERVADMNKKLLRIRSLQYQQRQAEKILARASEIIPDNIWLNVIQVNRQWVDINGQGKDVARLTVLLESLKGVKQVLLLGAIRPDARTGLETFQLRLMLADREPM